MSKIPPNLQTELVARATEGWSSQQIADWLKTEHGVDVSHAAVRKRLAATRTDRAEAAKLVVRETLSRTLGEDIRCLDELRIEAVRRCKAAPDDKTWALLADQARKLIDTKLHYSGADQPDDPKLSGLADFLGTVLRAESAGDGDD